LFQTFGIVPPGAPTLPVRTLRKKRARGTDQPPRWPAAAARRWRGDRRPGPPDLVGDVVDHRRGHAALGLGPLGGVLAVDLFEQLDEAVE